MRKAYSQARAAGYSRLELLRVAVLVFRLARPDPWPPSGVRQALQ